MLKFKAVSILLVAVLIMPVFPAYAFDAGCVAYFPFEENQGFSVYSVQTDKIVGITENPVWQDGVRGKAMKAGNGGIRFQEGRISKQLDQKEGVGFSVWVYLNNHNKPADLIKLYTLGNNYGFSAGLTADGNIKVIVKSCENDLTQVVLFTGTKAQGWHHYAVSVHFGEDKIECYLDSVRQGTKTKVNFTSPKLMAVDSKMEDVLGSPGLMIDEARVYGAALSASDVSAEYAKKNTAPEQLEIPGGAAQNLTPIGDWSFNEPSGGTVFDKTSNGINGTLINTNRTAGINGNGINTVSRHKSRVDIGRGIAQGLEGARGITVSMWVSPDMRPSNFNRLFSTYIDGTRAGLHFNYSGKNLTIGGRSCPQDGYLSKVFPWNNNTFLPGRWVHLSAVMDFVNKETRLYVNGIELTPSDGSSRVNFASNFYVNGTTPYHDSIGGDALVVNSFGGLIDEVKVFDTALSGEDILLLKNQFDSKAKTSRETDSELITRLKEKTRGFIALYTGSSDVISGDKMTKLDKTDYTLTARLIDETVYVPLSFFDNYLQCITSYSSKARTATIIAAGKKLTLKADEPAYYADGVRKTSLPMRIENGIAYLPLRALVCPLGKKVFWDDRGLAVVMPKSEVLSADADADIINRLVEFFNNDHFVPPVRPHEQTRQVVEYMPKETAVFLASPAIVRLPGGKMLIAMDYPGNAAVRSQLGIEGTGVYESADDGKTWNKIAMINAMGWASIFEHNNDIYLMGVKSKTIAITKSSDGGKTWTNITNEKSGMLNVDPQNITDAHCASTPILKANGRLYKAYETDVWTESMKAYIVSAPENADLLNAASWTVSDIIPMNPGWLSSRMTAYLPGWLEGNVVQAPDGSIKNVIRVNTEPASGYAAVLHLAANNRTLSFDPSHDLIHMDGGMTKFTIRKDEKSGYYVTLVNNVTNENFPMQRNVLSLSISRDLINWEIVETILVDRTLMNFEDSITGHAFQYVDWVFDDDNMLLAVRESMDDSENNHDANYITYYKIKNFREKFPD